MTIAEETSAIPHQSYVALFLRFLRFGSLAWGGPVAQIAMIKRELVEEEHWISPERFNRALALYQVLPGPEAHELCVYFGMLARGRLGGFLAGFGFMLPGFVFMFMLSWLYVASEGKVAAEWAPVFAALQAAVVALIVRAIHRIGAHAVHDRWLLALAVASCVAGVAGVHFAISLVLAGAFYSFLGKSRYLACLGVGLAWVAAIVYCMLAPAAPHAADLAQGQLAGPVSIPVLFYSGLRSGLLTFGGAYTVIPFLQKDAVLVGRWMTNGQFLDGLALSGILPAPLIIFSTFVGFLGGGVLGALVLTVGIFLPAFGFTLVAHDQLERLTRNEKLRRFLDGITAGVVGLIGATTVQLAPAALGSAKAVGVFAVALVLLYLVKHKLNVLLVIGVAAMAGKLFF
jgi:chromate transporter